MIYAIDITMRSEKWHTKPYAVETSFLCLHNAETAYGDGYYGRDTVETVTVLQRPKKKDRHCTENDISFYVLVRLQP
jgi:hypothetical protein